MIIYVGSRTPLKPRKENQTVRVPLQNQQNEMEHTHFSKSKRMVLRIEWGSPCIKILPIPFWLPLGKTQQAAPTPVRGLRSRDSSG